MYTKLRSHTVCTDTAVTRSTESIGYEANIMLSVSQFDGGIHPDYELLAISMKNESYLLHSSSIIPHPKLSLAKYKLVHYSAP